MNMDALVELLTNMPEAGSMEFARGFELGQLYVQLYHGMRGDQSTFTMQEANIEAVTRLARHFNFSTTYAPWGERRGWVVATFHRGQSKPRLSRVK